MKINRDYEKMSAEGYFNVNNITEDSCCMDKAFDMNACPNVQEMSSNIPGVVCPPIYECPRETVCHRYICHEVPHIMPCNTRIINHHIYRHTYTPTYSCCEENEIQNVYERRCC